MLKARQDNPQNGRKVQSTEHNKRNGTMGRKVTSDSLTGKLIMDVYLDVFIKLKH